jgi:hypothetical protein
MNVDLDQAWQQLINSLSLPTRVLLDNHAQILRVDGDRVSLGFKNKALRDIAIKKEGEITEAGCLAFQGNYKFGFEVVCEAKNSAIQRIQPQKPLIIKVPTLNDEESDFIRMFRWLQDAHQDKFAGKLVSFDFSGCDFLRPNAVAFLGGLARFIELHGGRLELDLASMKEPIKNNLQKNGFINYFDKDSSSSYDMGNTVPYYEYLEPDDNHFLEYLDRHWLGRNWVSVSSELKDKIISTVSEIYLNVFEHSDSNIGMFTCGQYFPNLKQLHLTIVDFGVGIPVKVKSHSQDKAKYSDSECMEWAFQYGTTTRTNSPGGNGLHLLKNFIISNKGKLSVFSLNGYTCVDASGETHICFEETFLGTFVNISIMCDGKFYDLSYI